ncbi:MAG: hypothetical protein WCG48_01195 [Candidatus Berkelbacteria bacterium]
MYNYLVYQLVHMIWLGVTALAFVVLMVQLYIGLRPNPSNSIWHRKWLWVIFVFLMIVHATLAMLLYKIF